MKTPQLNREHLANAKTIRKQLLGNPDFYVDSVGKVDLINLAPDPKASERGGAVLRLILGATERMPFRALSYIDSAVRSTEALAIDQLQIIHANSVGKRINGIDKSKADDAAKRLVDATAEIAAIRQNNDLSILHAIDTPLDTARYEPLAQFALEHNPAVANKLFQRGAKHGGDALAYTAVHFAFQDTNALELQPIEPDSPTQINRERIISIGCQQEHTFYLARMAMRQFSDEHDGMIDHTAQIFTKHVVPPYYSARGGEPMLEEGINPEKFGLLGTDAADNLELIGDPAARRDIRHFITVNHSEMETTNE